MYVWMQGTATPTEIIAMRTELHQFPGVERCVYWTQRRDYQEAKQTLPPRMFKVLTVAITPSSFRCAATTSTVVHYAMRDLSNQPGVLRVTAIHVTATTSPTAPLHA
jgi:FtsX extracellular domain